MKVRNGLRARWAATVAGLVICGSIRANPVLPTVVNGQAGFATQGNVLSITNTPGAIINWQSFSIGATEATRFIQQSAASSVLNRVTGGDTSRILGQLQSNGRVFLINPNGITFGAGSIIDVAGLVASTLNLSNADFLTGRNNFSALPGAGNISNNGEITTPSGGIVYLVAPNVENAGIIHAPNGEIMLAAGKSVNLVDSANPAIAVEVNAASNQAINLGNLIAQSGRIGIFAAAIRNSGSINADSAVLGADGNILLRATRDVTLDANSTITANGGSGGNVVIQGGGTTLNSGAIQAMGNNGAGGGISLLGSQVGLDGNAAVDASGTTGGGTILVGGDFHGSGPQQNASATYVGASVVIRADALTSGNGGKIAVWSGNATRFYGSINANGGQQAGNGGFVEVSGKKVLDYNGLVSTGAPHGRLGTLLLDPADITIVGSGTALPADIASFGAGPSGSYSISPAALDATGANVILQAQNDIVVTDAVSLTATPNANLTMQAGRNITVNNLVQTNGSGNITLIANNVANDATDAGGQALTGSGGVGRGSGAASLTINGAVVSGSGNLKLVNSPSGANNGSTGNVMLGANVTTDGGIVVQAGGDVIQNAGSISNYLGGSSTAAGTHDIAIAGNNVTLRSVGSQHDIMVNAAQTLTIATPNPNVQSSSQVTGSQNFQNVDDQYFTYTLPFGFSFYGTVYNQVAVSSNGLLTFSEPQQSNYPAGTGWSPYTDSLGALASHIAIAPAWNDWITSSTPVKDIYVSTGAGSIAFIWDVARYGAPSLTAQFSAVLSSNGSIAFNYGYANTSFNGDVTIGLSNGTAATASQLMTAPNFSLNGLNSTMFTPNGSGGYAETVSSGSNWSYANLGANGGVNYVSGGASIGGGLNAVGNVQIRAANVVNASTDTGTKNISAASLAMNADSGIGDVNAPLTTAVSMLSASNSGTGAITLNNSGILDITGITNGGGDILLNNTGALTANGAISATGNISLMAADGIAVKAALNGNNLTLNSTGNVNMASSLGASGNLDVQSGGVAGTGNIIFSGGTSTVSGKLSAGSITVSGAMVTLNGALTVSALTLSDGTLNLNSPDPVSIALLNLSGGELSGTAPVTTANMVWSGGTLSATGAATATTTASVALTVTSSLDMTPPGSLWLYDRVLNNYGSARQGAGGPGTVDLYIKNGAIVNNAVGASWNFNGANVYDPGLPGVFNNMGTLIVSPASPVTMTVLLSNSGTMNVAGSLYLNAGFSNTGILNGAVNLPVVAPPSTSTRATQAAAQLTAQLTSAVDIALASSPVSVPNSSASGSSTNAATTQSTDTQKNKAATAAAPVATTAGQKPAQEAPPKMSNMCSI